MFIFLPPYFPRAVVLVSKLELWSAVNGGVVMSVAHRRSLHLGLMWTFVSYRMRREKIHPFFFLVVMLGIR